MKRYTCIHRPAEDGFECQNVFDPASYACSHCYYRQELHWYDCLFWPAIIVFLMSGICYLIFKLIGGQMDSYTVTPRILSSALNYVSDYDNRRNRNFQHSDKRSVLRFVCDKCHEVYIVFEEHKRIHVEYYGCGHIPTLGLPHQDCPVCSMMELKNMRFVHNQDAERWLK